MNIASAVPGAPSGKIASWIAFASFVLIIAFVVDNYWGKGDLFGLAKKTTPAPVV